MRKNNIKAIGLLIDLIARIKSATHYPKEPLLEDLIEILKILENKDN